MNKDERKVKLWYDLDYNLVYKIVNNCVHVWCIDMWHESSVSINALYEGMDHFEIVPLIW